MAGVGGNNQCKTAAVWDGNMWSLEVGYTQAVTSWNYAKINWTKLHKIIKDSGKPMCFLTWGPQNHQASHFFCRKKTRWFWDPSILSTPRVAQFWTRRVGENGLDPAESWSDMDNPPWIKTRFRTALDLYSHVSLLQGFSYFPLLSYVGPGNDHRNGYCEQSVGQKCPVSWNRMAVGPWWTPKWVGLMDVHHLKPGIYRYWSRVKWGVVYDPENKELKLGVSWGWIGKNLEVGWSGANLGVR